jgi:hypothetical protein
MHGVTICGMDPQTGLLAIARPQLSEAKYHHLPPISPVTLRRFDTYVANRTPFLVDLQHTDGLAAFTDNVEKVQ